MRQPRLNCLHVGDPVASVSLQAVVHESLVPATTPQPAGQEYYYDSDDSVVNFDAKFPDISEQVVEWRAARQAAAPLPLWWPHNFGKVKRACYKREPDLREVLNQTRQQRMVANIPVTPLTLPHQEVHVFESVRNLDRQHQQQFDQTVAKRQPSLLEDKQCKRTKTPPQLDPEDAPSRECSWADRHRNMNVAIPKLEGVMTGRKS